MSNKGNGNGAKTAAGTVDDVSRRAFLKTSAAGAGVAAGVGVAGQAMGATIPEMGIPSITIPKEIKKYFTDMLIVLHRLLYIPKLYISLLKT